MPTPTTAAKDGAPVLDSAAPADSIVDLQDVPNERLTPSVTVPTPLPPSLEKPRKSAPKLDVREGGLGQFTHQVKINSGGLSRIYRAIDAGLKRHVVIKTLRLRYAFDRNARRRLIREGQLLAEIKSSHVIEVYGIGRTRIAPNRVAQARASNNGNDKLIYLVLPLLEGQSLDKYIRENPQAPVDVTLQVAEEVSLALVATHKAGIIHRDVKPGNIWLEQQPLSASISRCILLDYGLARRQNRPSVLSRMESELTGTHVTIGTPEYMPFEQAECSKTVEPPADVFGLGVSLYEMATGTRPYGKINQCHRVAARALKDLETPKPVHTLVPDFPEELSKLIDRMLSLEPAQRPPAIEIVKRVQKLRAARNSQGGFSIGTAIRSTYRSLPAAYRRLIAPLAVCTVLLALMATVLLFAR